MKTSKKKKKEWEKDDEEKNIQNNWIIDEYNGQNIIKNSRRFYTNLKTNRKQIYTYHTESHKHTINNFIWNNLIVEMPVVRCSNRINNETIWSQIDEIISTAQSYAHKTETVSVWITNKMHDWNNNRL